MNKDVEMLKGRLGHINKTPLEEALEMLENISKEEIVVRDRSTVYMNPNDNGKGAFTHLTTVGVNFKGAIETIRESLINAQENNKLLIAKKEGFFDGYSMWRNDEFVIDYDTIRNEYCLRSITNGYTLGKTRFYESDYKKTWWLKEDKSE